MPEQRKIDLAQLEAGYDFPSASYHLTPEVVAEYLDIIGEASGLYGQGNPLPPIAVGAKAMAALIGGVSFPAGSIHVSQEFKFLRETSFEDTFTSHSRISRKHERGGMRIMTIEILVTNQRDEDVLEGKTSFILPQQQ
jgi:hypothetical protein